MRELEPNPTKILDFIKARRKELGFSCRDFGLFLKMKPSEWNRMENGRMPFPKEHAFEKRLVKALCINTEEYPAFHAAYMDYEPIAREPLTEEEVVQKLPMVFRKQDGSAMSEPELLKLGERLRHELS